MKKMDVSEQEFLRNYSIHDYEVPLTSVDLVIFTLTDYRLKVLLVRRGEHPFKGSWALPGGFIDIAQDDDLDATALRKLKAKTGVQTPYLEQLQGFGSRTRDPRGWSTTFTYFALIDSTEVQLRHGAGADAVAWFDVDNLKADLELAFDHHQILALAIQRLRSKVEYSSLPVYLLPAEFTLTELQQVYESLLGHSVDKSAFRKRIKDGDFLEELAGKWRHGSNRPAQLFRAKSQGVAVYYNRIIAGRSSDVGK